MNAMYIIFTDIIIYAKASSVRVFCPKYSHAGGLSINNYVCENNVHGIHVREYYY